MLYQWNRQTLAKVPIDLYDCGQQNLPDIYDIWTGVESSP